jgi:hypothetical protein
MKIEELKKLAGIRAEDHSMGHEMGKRSGELASYAKKHNIKPGDPEWFKLWFAKPHLTGENPTPRSGKHSKKDA